TWLLVRQATEVDDYLNSARIYSKMAEANVKAAAEYIANSEGSDVALFKAVEAEI
ncbi:MAG: hypothetical protein IJ957_01095, partial [Rikenellaceae bacterium]|nr:hypothetical protein [Rikenellaceae bacterium]